MASLKKYFSILNVLIATAFLFMLIFSVSRLTTYPRLWVDEAKNIEIAQSYNTSGILDMEIAPGHFTGAPQLLQSTGYPVTLPLSLVFKFFGFGLTQARIYMILWMLSAIVVLYWLLRRVFGERAAVFGVLLVVTFASFYDNGRPMMGEIPGFFFLISALYFWLRGEFLWKAGLLFGLAVVAKPSVYLLIIPALFLTLVFRKSGIKNLLVLAAAMLPAALGWIIMVMDNPFSKLAWLQIIYNYANPYNGVSIAENILKNIAAIPQTPTVIYFGVFFLILLCARIWSPKEKPAISLFYDFVLFYSVFALIYYLRSPGWLRYTIVSELLLLSLFPNALEVVLRSAATRFPNDAIFKKSAVLNGALSCLIAFQLFHLFTGAKIYFSDADIKTADYIEKTFSGKTVAYLDALNVAIFHDRNFRYTTLDDSVVPVLKSGNTFRNISPLVLPILPDAVVASAGEVFTSADSVVLGSRYQIKTTTGDYVIYSKR